MGKRKEGKKKPKSVKANVNSRMNAKRKLSRLGKKVKKGKAGPNTEFITRSAAMRKLQITLKDFRRLCILKGVYPRVPTKPLKGADKIYYDIKDISYIANEPLVEKFREFKAFMKKIRRAAGRNQFSEARRVNELKPRMVLDHLVKERYPRFIDAVRDLDDCLCMIHLFAALPSVGRITADRTSACGKLAREWQYYVSKSRSLRKVFVSVKGIYYQAEIMGETINWLVPHAFTQHIPPAVDFRVMVTFMEFYEIFFKFVLYKLYAKEEWQYPPQVDERLDHAGCCLLAMKSGSDSATASSTTNANQRSTGKDAKKQKSKQDENAVALVTAVDAKEFQGKVKSLPEFLKQQQQDRETGNDSEEEEDELDISAPLAAAFSDLQRHNDEVDDNEGEVFRRNQDSSAQEDQRKHLFSKLTFFINREVPLSIMQLCITAFGGRVSWDGPSAPYAADDRSITHQIVDRPVQNQAIVAGSVPREYIQPQWVFDSINAGILLPTRLYAPAAKLPPHLSPFVDDEKEGYLPRYREEVQKLQVDAGVLEAPIGTTTTSAASKTKAPAASKAAVPTAATGKKRAAIDMDEDESEEEDDDDDDDEEEEDSDDDDDDDDEEEDDEEEEEDSEAEELLEVPTKSPLKNTKNSNNKNKDSSNNNQKQQQQQHNSTTKSNTNSNSNATNASVNSGKKGPKAIVQQAKVAKQSEAEELHELSVSMMSKKTKKLYDKMQFGIQQKQESVQRLEDKRRAVEKTENAQQGKQQSKKQRRG